MRDSLVFVWHAGQSGRGMVTLLRLESGGSVTELSATGRCQGETVMDHPGTARDAALVNFAHMPREN
jgi:hypothetical protein